MATVNQLTPNPTNKLTAAVLATAAMSVSGLVIRNLFPEWYDPDVWASVAPLAAFAIGWFVKDQPNVAIVVEEEKT